MRAYIILYILYAAVITMACSSPKKMVAPVASPVGGVNGAATHGQAVAQPRAVVYRTVGDYRNLVPVTMATNGKTIASFPDPTDVRGCAPIELRDGYLLDRRGVSERTAFLDYTYEQYAALSTPPTLAELQRHIVDASPMAELYRLPISSSEAQADTARCNAIIAGGFKDCTSSRKMPALDRK